MPKGSRGVTATNVCLFEEFIFEEAAFHPAEPATRPYVPFCLGPTKYCPARPKQNKL